jgi:hypothetical protein
MKRLHMIPCLFILSIVLVCISYPVMSAHAKKVIIENITLNVTVIIPITVVAQNAQICISLASSGDQTCQQLILDPTQTTFTAVDVDLTQEVPVITSGSTNQTSTTTPPGSNETSSFAGNSNKTFEPGKSNITNPTNDHESKNNGRDTSTDSTASDKQNVEEDKDKDTNEQQQEENPESNDGESSEDGESTSNTN